MVHTINKKIWLGCILVLLVAFAIFAAHNIKISNACKKIESSLDSLDYTVAEETVNKFASNKRVRETYETMLPLNFKNRLNEFKSATNEAAVNKEKENIVSLINMNVLTLMDDNDKALMKNSYIEYYEDLYTNSEDFELSKTKLDSIIEFNCPEFIPNEQDFFEEKFNGIMADFCSEKITKDRAVLLYKYLQPLELYNSAFIEDRVKKVFSSYNEGQFKYSVATQWYGILQEAGFVDAEIKNKSDDIISLYNSKNSFTVALDAMSKNDYITAISNFNKVIADDTNYEQKNQYVQQIIPKAKDYAIGQINSLCAAHKYDEARAVITKFDPYINSQELRNKKNDIDTNETNYKKAVELEQKKNQVRSAIRINGIETSKPNSAGGVDLYIYWVNKSNKVIKYISFTAEPYNAVNDKVYDTIGRGSSFTGKDTGPINPGEGNQKKYETIYYEYLNKSETYVSSRGYYWDCAWYNNTIKYAKIVGIKIEYMDGTKLEFDESVAPYAVY